MYAKEERVVSNLARFVVIVWCFVVLILTQSYTASLTSLLTVRQLQPAVNDVNQILKNRQNVGYLKGSFVHGILKQLGFEDNNLKTYNSPEQLDELFANKSGNDGIVAAFDERPSLKPFLAKYCSKYTMVEPTFKANGFGFAFPKDSPLVGDISRAILKVTEGNRIREIENKWFKAESGCPDPSDRDVISSQSLGLDSFWGLFLIAGVVSSLALLIFAATFLHENRHFLSGSGPDLGASMWKRIQLIFGIFNQRDLNSHTYKRNEAQEKSVFGGSSPNTNCPPSPSWYSYHTDRSNVGGSVSPQPGHGHGHGSIVDSPNGDEATMEIINLSSVDVGHELTFPSPSADPYNSTTENLSMFVFQEHDA
uniref:glutamate receptor 2.9-like n=1 Tax=Ziziphus jujuba TaxID=326968 RepID=A0A6P3Z5B2_ZIZJJ